MARRENRKRTTNAPERPPAFERAYRILEYLMKNTDSEHTTNQVKLSKIPELSIYTGSTDTNNSIIKSLADAMNYNSHEEIKPEEDWRIVFDWYTKNYGSGNDEDESDSESGKKPSFLSSGLYYNHIFSYKEIDYLIEGILFSKTLDEDSKHRIIKKIKDNLTTKFYKGGPDKIHTVRETIFGNRDRLRENLLLIQKAIDEKVQISFISNRYNRRKKLEPISDKRNTVSPYYIVAYGGRYYLIGGESFGQDEPRMSIRLIDLMTNISIPHHNGKGIPSPEKKDVKYLPDVWNDTFPLEHLYMSYDEPRLITLKIKSLKYGDKPPVADYTFLYDWFGDNFEYIKTYGEDDIVQVKCSKFGMINWAMQYCDRVEVIDPPEIRNEVIEKIKNLYSQYEVKL